MIKPANTVTPLVISASRATDIPAFHAQWFMEKIRKGFCERIHPQQPFRNTIISFSRCKILVFWTKNPRPLMPYLDELQDRGFQFYFHYTLNDYEEEHLEPGVPPLEQRLACFCALSEKIGRAKTLWRFDPIILGGGLTIPKILHKIQTVGQQLHMYTEKLIFSFLDMYPHIQHSLSAARLPFRVPTMAEQQEIAAGLIQLNRNWGLDLRSCAENLPLELGIRPNQCIDPNLIRRLYPNDPEIGHYCNRALASDQFSLPGVSTCCAAKDPVQRTL